MKWTFAHFLSYELKQWKIPSNQFDDAAKVRKKNIKQKIGFTTTDVSFYA